MMIQQLAGLIAKPTNSILKTAMAEAFRQALRHRQVRQKAGA